ncbi:hypothetical protein TrLO_g11801 [Triparma laevis f. longispina]|uniref:Uncharacterized protein n=1 Tax=Triparma laevis f. longispina TaxID=1714387 RepID=A0A9W7CIT3_9STRA|nr:hypothetical protein TrLO_g11801 [Triparma laevis f. longispina]
MGFKVKRNCEESHDERRESVAIHVIRVQSDPRFTNAGVDDDIEFSGELKQMNFKLLVYQHGDHMKAVMLALWAFVEVDGEVEKKKMER